MAERDLDFKLAEKLILAHQSRQNFAKAIEIAEQLTYLPDQRSLYTRVGKGQAQIGLNPAPSLEFLARFRQTADKNIKRWGGNVSHEKIGARYNMAEILMEMGDVESAFDLTAPEGGAFHPLQLGFDLRLSRKMFQKGQDPQPVLDRALASAGLIGVSDGYKSDIMFKEDVKVWDYAAASKAYYDVKKDYQSLLAKTLSLASKLKYHQSESFSFLAQAYAHCDDLESALQAIKLMGEDKNLSKEQLRVEQVKTLKKIARSRLLQGDIHGVRKFTLRAGDNLFVAEIIAESVCLQPESSKSSLDWALEYRNLPLSEYSKTRGKNGPADYDLVRLAVIDSLIGRAKFILGEDGSAFFDKALETAGLLEDYDDRVIAFNGIAKNQALSGLDARPTWELSFRAADEILENFDGKLDWINMAEYSIYMEDMAETQVECGCFELAKETTDKIVAVEIDAGADINASLFFKGKILSDSAVKQGERGFSNTEITDLPVDEIRAILISDHELAKEAVRYFGLDKKVE